MLFGVLWRGLKLSLPRGVSFLLPSFLLLFRATPTWVVYTHTAQKKKKPRTPATNLLGRWRALSNSGVPAPTSQSWKEQGAWVGHSHALPSLASPAAPCHPFLSYVHSPANKERQRVWGGGLRTKDYDCCLTTWGWISLSRNRGWWYTLWPLS